MSQNKHYQVNPVVSFGDEEDGAVLYNPDTDQTSIVNVSGRELWTFLATPHTEREIVEHLIQEYSNVTMDQAAADVKQFIETLLPDFLQQIDNEN